MKKILLQDITIPAGTVFEEAPSKTTRSKGHFSHTIGLTKDTSGDLTYYIDPDDSELKIFFAEESGPTIGKKCPNVITIENGNWHSSPKRSHDPETCGGCQYEQLCSE